MDRKQNAMWSIVPPSVQLKGSLSDHESQGVFCVARIKSGSKFGPFKGDIINIKDKERIEKEVDFRFAWHLENSRGKIESIVNATNPSRGNWLRFVNCARYFEEQNLVAEQEGREIYYRTIKDINPGEELLTWYDRAEQKRSSRKRRSRAGTYTFEWVPAKSPEPEQPVGKRLRKKKEMGTDMLSLDDHDVVFASSGLHHNRIRNGAALGGLHRSTSLPSPKFQEQSKILPSPKFQEQSKIKAPPTFELKIKLQTPVNELKIKNQKSFTESKTKAQTSMIKLKMTTETPVTEAKTNIQRPISEVKLKTRMPLTAAVKTLVSSCQQTDTVTDDVLKIMKPVVQLHPCQLPKSGPPLTGKKRSINQIIDSLKMSKEIANMGNSLLNRGSQENAGQMAAICVEKLAVCSVSRPSSASSSSSRRSSLVGTAEDIEEHLMTNYQFLFNILDCNRLLGTNGENNGYKYQCSICQGTQYHKALSLKCHFIREHINHKYLSKDDINLLSQVKTKGKEHIEADLDPDADDSQVFDNSLGGEVDKEDSSVKCPDEEKGKNCTSHNIKEEPVYRKTSGSQKDKEMSTASNKSSQEEDEKRLTSVPLNGKITFSFQGIDGVTDAFRCSLCVQLFPNMEKLQQHLEKDSHRSRHDKQFGCDRCGMRFHFHHNFQHHMETHGISTDLATSCIVCGKKFLNEVNMRKHLRFHSGRNFPCKQGCKLVYPNVAELVKHLRMVHPDRHKQQTQAVQPQGAESPKRRGRPLKNVLPKSPSITAPIKQESVEYQTEEEARQEYEALHPDGWTDPRGRKPRPGIVGVVCTICKKMFSTYGSMYRHRRSVHRVAFYAQPLNSRDSASASDSPPLAPAQEEMEDEEVWEVNPASRISRHIEARVEKMYLEIEYQQRKREEKEKQERQTFSVPGDSLPPSPYSFYARVSDMVAENMTDYIDGGAESLKNAHHYITVPDYVPLKQAQDIVEPKFHIDWSCYNFPPFFLPVYPVIAHPPAKKSLPIPQTPNKMPAYPTRAFLAERRASGGPSEHRSHNRDVAEDRLPRRSSVGSLELPSHETEKLVRRASVGSFSNPKEKEQEADGLSQEINSEITEGNVFDDADDKTVLKQIQLEDNFNSKETDEAADQTLPTNDNDDATSTCTEHGPVNKPELGQTSLGFLSIDASKEEIDTVQTIEERKDKDFSNSHNADLPHYDNTLESASLKLVSKELNKNSTNVKLCTSLQPEISGLEDQVESLKKQVEEIYPMKDNSSHRRQDETMSTKEHSYQSRDCKEASEAKDCDSNTDKTDVSVLEITDKQIHDSFHAGSFKACGNDKLTAIKMKDEENLEAKQYESTTSSIIKSVEINKSYPQGHFKTSYEKNLNQIEMSYLSTGTICYVRANEKQPCTHVQKQVIVARPLQNKTEVEYMSGLELKVKKLVVKKNVLEFVTNGKQGDEGNSLPAVNSAVKMNSECVKEEWASEKDSSRKSSECVIDTKSLEKSICQKTSECVIDHKSSEKDCKQVTSECVIDHNSLEKGISQKTSECVVDQKSSKKDCKQMTSDCVIYHNSLEKDHIHKISQCAVQQETTENENKQNGSNCIREQDASEKTSNPKTFGDNDTPPKSPSATREAVCQNGCLQAAVDALDKSQDLSKLSLGTSQQADRAKEPDEKTAVDEVKDDVELDGQVLSVRASLALQELQERVAIDLEEDETCRLCQLQSSEMSSPANRSASDFMKMRFGRSHPVFVVCSLCHRYFYDVDSLLRHQLARHPTIHCSHFEVENGYFLEKLLYPEPSTNGVLAQSVLVPPEYTFQESYKCTKCRISVKQYSRLRHHIQNCNPNSPTMGHSRKKKLKSTVNPRLEAAKTDNSFRTKKEQESFIFNSCKDWSMRNTGPDAGGSGGRKGVALTVVYQTNKKASKTIDSSSKVKSVFPMNKPYHVHLKHASVTRKLNLPSHEATTSCRAQKRRNYELLYNPAAHVRRREKTDVVDIHQCQGCGLKFRTLSLLERHTKNCIGKDKLLNHKLSSGRNLDGEQGGKKHFCHYCPKRFKYLKGVFNHYSNNFCHVRAQRLVGEGLSLQDQEHEAQLKVLLVQQTWNKMENRDHTDIIQGRAHLHDDGTIVHTRRKGGWPKGLKRSYKRRRNGWTYVKKRKEGSGSETPSSSTSRSPKQSSSLSSVVTSSSTTSVAMSELEARLREPIKSKKRKLEQSHLTPDLNSTRKSGRKVDTDRSKAPVIDRMDTLHPRPRNAHQMLGDPEPPPLSPVSPSPETPASSSDTPETPPKRRKKIASSDSGAAKAKNQKTVAALTEAKITKPAGQQLLLPQFSKDGLPTPIYILEQVAHPSGKGPQFKLVQLKIPSLVALQDKSVALSLPIINSNQSQAAAGSPFTTVSCQDEDLPTSVSQKDAPPTTSASHKDALPTTCANQEEMSHGISASTREVPPNFLFPPPSDRLEEAPKLKDSDQFNRSSTLEMSASCKKSLETNSDLSTPAINTIFKNRRSPCHLNSSSKSSNVKKNSSSASVLNLSSLSFNSVSPSVEKTTESGTKQTWTAPARAGVTVLPPGSLFAYLPSTPKTAQRSQPASISASASAATPPSRGITTNEALHTAVAEGKILILDPRHLPSLMSTSTSVPALLSPTKTSIGLVNIGKPSVVKTSPSEIAVKTQLQDSSSIFSKKATANSEVSYKNVKTESLLSAELTKLSVPLPNFLFDDRKDPKDSLVQLPSSEMKKASQQVKKKSVAAAAIPCGDKQQATKRPKRGPPPSTSNKIKSMVIMTSPGKHVVVSLDPAPHKGKKSGAGQKVVPSPVRKYCAIAPACGSSKHNNHDNSFKTEIVDTRIKNSKSLKHLAEHSGKSESEIATGISSPKSKAIMSSAKGAKNGLGSMEDKSINKSGCVLKVPVIDSRLNVRPLSPASDDDLPLSLVVASAKHKE